MVDIPDLFFTLEIWEKTIIVIEVRTNTILMKVKHRYCGKNELGYSICLKFAIISRFYLS